MRALFLAVLVVGMVYFLAIRRGVDFYTLAFAASGIYFVPGVVGYDLPGTPIQPKTYAIFLLVLASLLVAGALRPPRPPHALREPHGYAPALAAGLALAVVSYVLVANGYAALFRDKGDQGVAAAAYVIWRVAASFAVVFGVLARRRGVLLCGLFGLLLMFLASDRTAVAMVVAALGVGLLGRRRVSPLRAAGLWAIPLALALVVVWGGKLMQIAIRQSFHHGNVSDAVGLLADPAALRLVTTSAEPFIIQAHLNQAVRRDMYVGPRHLVGVAYQLWPAPSMFGHPTNEFNDILQDELFPQARKNTLAYNFWAEGLVSGGWLLLFLYVVIYAAGIEAANAVARSPNVAHRGIALLMGAYWAVYIHRNSAASIVAYEKQVLFLGLLILVGSALLPAPARRPAPGGAAVGPVPPPPLAGAA